MSNLPLFQQPEKASCEASPRSQGVPFTHRAIILSLALIPLNVWWVAQIEFVRYSDMIDTPSLFFNAVTLIPLLLLVNVGLSRFRPHWRLSGSEIALIYIVVSVSTNLAGHNQLQILFTTITYITRHSAIGSPWAERLLPLAPASAIVTDRVAVTDLYVGHSTLYTGEHLRAWVGPVLWWSVFAMLVVWVMLCIAAIFRRQWDAERLAYPIVEVPLLLISEPRRTFRSAFLWIGVGVGAVPQVVNALHAFWPSIPGLSLGLQYIDLGSPPFGAAGPIPLLFYPAVFGLAFLLPVQLSFSCWFFYLVNRVEIVCAVAAGHSTEQGFPYVNEQGVGAALGIGLLVLWNARRHLRHVGRAAFGLERACDDEEPLPYRVAFFGFLLGGIGLLALARQIGMSVGVGVCYFAVFLFVVLVVARIRAQVGLPTFELWQAGGDEVLTRVAGSRYWSGQDLTAMTLFYWLTRTSRQLPIQTQVDSYRLGHRLHVSLRSLTGVMVLASGFSIVCAFWAMLHVTYQTGFESARFQGPALPAFGNAPWQRLDTWLQSPTRPSPGVAGAYAFGAISVLVLGFLQARFLEWPVHPIGYLAASSLGVMRLWFPLFVCSGLKWAILRYGGLGGYRKALPLFVGMVLGEFGAAFFKTIIGLGLGLPMPPGSGTGGF